MALGTARLGPAGKIRSRTLHGSARLPRNAQHFETVVDITITPAWSRSGHLVFFLSYELHSPVLDDFPTNTRASTHDASYDPSIFHNHDSSPATICNLRHAALVSCRISGACADVYATILKADSELLFTNIVRAFAVSPLFFVWPEDRTVIMRIA